MAESPATGRRQRIPEPDGIVPRCRCEELAIRRVRVALESATTGPRQRIPEPDGFVVRCRCEVLSIRRECHCPDRVRMALESAATGPSQRIPEPDGFVVRCRCEELAIRREYHSPIGIQMALEHLQHRVLIPGNRRWISDPVRDIVPKLFLDCATLWAERQSGAIYLERRNLDDRSEIEYETHCVTSHCA